SSLRDSVSLLRLPGTAVPGFPMPPLRGWGGDSCYKVAFSVLPKGRASKTYRGVKAVVEEIVRGDPVDGSGLGDRRKVLRCAQNDIHQEDIHSHCDWHACYGRGGAAGAAVTALAGTVTL